MDELSPAAYFDAVAQAVADQPRWEVLSDDMVLWFFSFAKYLMYRDLDPATWPEHSPLGEQPDPVGASWVTGSPPSRALCRRRRQDRPADPARATWSTSPTPTVRRRS